MNKEQIEARQSEILDEVEKTDDPVIIERLKKEFHALHNMYSNVVPKKERLLKTIATIERLFPNNSFTKPVVEILSAEIEKENEENK